MRINSVAIVALSVAGLGFAGDVEASTCSVIPGDREITFTLTQGNPKKVVDQACLGGENGVSGQSGLNESVWSNAWGIPETPSIRAERRGGLARRAGFGSAGGGSARALGGGDPVSQSTENWSGPGVAYSGCQKPDSTDADGVSEGEELVCVSNVEDDVPTAVPLPAAGGMLFAALGGMILTRRRRKL